MTARRPRKPRVGRPPLGAAARSVRLQIFVTPAVESRLADRAKAATRIARQDDPEAARVKPTALAADMLERALDATEPTT